jgi:6-phosphogluconolactonase
MNPEIRFFTSDVELARAAATAWLEEVANASQVGESHCVALSGGRITLRFFAEVIAQLKARGSSLGNSEFFWADERCVPPDDPDSNFAAADRHFFQPLSVPKYRIHRILGEENPAFAAQQAEAEIFRIVPINAKGQPAFDLIFLGMGEDGHVASLFPGEPPVKDETVYRTIDNSPKPPPKRITLGYSTIAAAKQVWVLAAGAGKEAAFRESLRPDGQTPLARVLQAHPRAKVFTDISLK